MLVCCRLQPFWTGNSLDRVKEAGFHGVCFDIEMTKGEKELAEAFEKAFAACRSAGLLVLVTTSHSAPYAASSDNAKELLVDSWVASKNIDIFSPQLYTSGTEAAPEFDEAPCHVGHTGWGWRDEFHLHIVQSWGELHGLHRAHDPQAAHGVHDCY